MSQNRDIRLKARLGYEEKDKAWRKLSGQKQEVFYLTRIDQIGGDEHLI